jgi:hypothetical protein
VTQATAPGSPEDRALQLSAAARRQCICQEDPDSGPCEHAAPVTREQLGRLRAYATTHPERAFIMSEITGEWMSALADSLPPGVNAEDRVLAWMHAPYELPPTADLRASADLAGLLDMLGAPQPAAMSQNAATTRTATTWSGAA